MARISSKARLLATALPMALPLAMLASTQAYAQAADPAGEVGEVVVTGIRGLPRSVEDSPVPVDVFNEEALEKVSQTDTLNTLQTLIPSYSLRRAANTTSDTFIRAPSLRGLSADKTLLLVNSRRRHKSASVGTSGTGSQAADAAVIPSIALKSVQVLRDGAAAQYGSDAIAGVINFLLKDDRQGGSINLQVGQFYEGDGKDVNLEGNIGLPLGEKGFVNLSGQWMHGDRTIRARQFVSTTFNAIDYFNQNPQLKPLVNLSQPLQRTGKPIEDAYRFVVNSGYDLTDNSQLYAFGNYSHSKGKAAANYRFPGGGQAVMDTPVRLQSGAVFRFKDIYPVGLQPLFSGEVTDWSAAGGWRTNLEFANGHTFTADLGARYGWDKIDYGITGTLNPSLGPTSQQDFRASNYVSNEFALNADFSYGVPLEVTATPLVFSFGAEYRKEGFEIRPGEPASYAAGTFANPDPFDFCTNETLVSQRTLRPTAPQNAGINCASSSDPVYRVLSVGSNGITGLPPSQTGEFESKSGSLYVEAATDITDNWFVDVALRYEDYDAFGDTTIGKVAMRYELTDRHSIRGSVGTGFRAPTAGQLNMTQTQINTVDGIPTNTGLYPASHPVAQFLGAKPLSPEKSTNYSIGFTANPFSSLQLTVDFYQIEVRDQLFSTAQIQVTPAIRAAMIAAGVVGAESIASINFFQNAFDSTVKGVDVVGSYRFDWDNGTKTDLVGSFNYNHYKIDEVKIPNLFTPQAKYNFEENNPVWRATLTATHEAGPWTAMVRANLYGPYSRQSTTSPFPIQDYDTELQMDVELERKIGESIRLAVGARNVFDNYPDPNRINASNGAIYVDGPVDWQGGFLYARITYDF